MRQIFNKIIVALKLVRGEKLYGLNILGIQIFLITKTNPYHINIFIFFLPLFRLEITPTRFGINILPLVWVYKTFKLIITGWNVRKTKYELCVYFLNKRVFSRSIVVPYNFPTALYRS